MRSALRFRDGSLFFADDSAHPAIKENVALFLGECDKWEVYDLACVSSVSQKQTDNACEEGVKREGDL